MRNIERENVDTFHPMSAPAADALNELLALRTGEAVPSDEVTIRGTDPFFPIPHRVGDATAASLAAVGVAVNDVWTTRGHERQHVELAVREAAASTKTVDYTQVQTATGAFAAIPRSPEQKHTASLIKPWPTRDGRWFLPHFSLPHLRRRVLEVLDCEPTPESVSAAVARWNADDLEQAIADARACGATVRSEEEWLAHPQGAYLAQRPVVSVDRVHDGSPDPLPRGDRPLSGIRVLDLTRILAGPIAGRTLAEHGADVLMVTAEDLPQMPEHVRDTSHGKRSTFVDLKTKAGVHKLEELVRGADVILDGYRPGRIGEIGFDLESLMELRPGLIHLNITCYGAGGPFQDRGGWDQVAQAASGMCEENGRLVGAGGPKLSFPPACDYNTGYLGAYGVLLALARRVREGGGFSVNVSLCQTAAYIMRRGVVARFESAAGMLTPYELQRRSVIADSSYGTLKTLGPVLDMSETPPFWARTTPHLGGDEAEWLPRER